MKQVVRVGLWDAILTSTLMGGALNPVLMAMQVGMSAWLVSGGDWEAYADSPVALAFYFGFGFLFYLALFQLVMLVLATLICVLNPKIKRGVLGEHTFEVRDEGLFESTAYNETLYKWAAVDKMHRMSGRVFVRVSGANWFVIPDRSFPSRAEALAFEQALRSRMRP